MALVSQLPPPVSWKDPPLAASRVILSVTTLDGRRLLRGSFPCDAPPSVYALKARIEQVEGTPVPRQRLVCGSEELKDTDLVAVDEEVSITFIREPLRYKDVTFLGRMDFLFDFGGLPIEDCVCRMEKVGDGEVTFQIASGPHGGKYLSEDAVSTSRHRARAEVSSRTTFRGTESESQPLVISSSEAEAEPDLRALGLGDGGEILLRRLALTDERQAWILEPIPAKVTRGVPSGSRSCSSVIRCCIRSPRVADGAEGAAMILYWRRRSRNDVLRLSDGSHGRLANDFDQFAVTNDSIVVLEPRRGPNDEACWFTLLDSR